MLAFHLSARDDDSAGLTVGFGFLKMMKLLSMAETVGCRVLRRTGPRGSRPVLFRFVWPLELVDVLLVCSLEEN